MFLIINKLRNKLSLRFNSYNKLWYTKNINSTSKVGYFALIYYSQFFKTKIDV